MARKEQVITLKNIIQHQDHKLMKKNKELEKRNAEFSALTEVAQSLLDERNQLLSRLKEVEEVDHG